MESLKGKRIYKYNYVCKVEGEEGDFYLHGPIRAHNGRVLRSDLDKARVLENYGCKVPKGKIRDRKTYGQWLFEHLDIEVEPELVADRVKRVDEQIEAHVNRRSKPGDTFNAVLRRLLEPLDPLPS